MRVFPVVKRLFSSCSWLSVGRPRSWDPPLRVTWSRLRKRFRLPSLENIEQFPDDFYTIHTEHGWVAVPQPLYVPTWTTEQLKQVWEKLCDPLLTVEARQRAVCEWAGTIDLSMPPEADAIDVIVKESAEDKLYHQQLEYVPRLPESEETAVLKPRRITGTHAWNYYNSQRFQEMKGTLPQEEIRKIIKSEWQSFDRAHKKEYLKKYSDLLDSGFILRRGEVVSIEEVNKKEADKKEADKKKADKKEANKKKADKKKL